MRKFFLILGVFILLVVISVILNNRSVSQTEPIELVGQWRFAIDREDVGTQEQWFKRKLSEAIRLPGTLQEQGFGDPVTAQTKWMSRLYDKFWYLRADYKKYAQPGNIKVPFWLQPQRHYSGVAWYQRPIAIPKDWRGQRVVVSFERVQWTSTVWLNDKRIGDNDSLSTAHEYDLGVLEPGEYVLTVRVDNRMQQDIREDAYSITDSTQTNWNGLVGGIQLRSTTPVWMKDVKVFPDIENKAVNLKIQIGNTTGQAGKGELTAADKHIAVNWTAEGGSAELTVPLGQDAGLWDEFKPSLHQITLRLRGDKANDQKDLVVGLREIKYMAIRCLYKDLRD